MSVIGAARGIAIAASMLGLAPAMASPACSDVVAALTADAMFQRYPARQLPGSHWRAPDVRHGEAHRFRTMLSRYGIGEPDFAGHYKIVGIGCGSGTVCPAFVDRLTGRVQFLPQLRSVGVMALDFEAGQDSYSRLNYRADSRLIVAVGARNEEKAAAGATLYDFRNGVLHFVRFIPEKALCMKKDGA